MLTSPLSPFHGLDCQILFDPGVSLRSTPGFMLTPAPQAEDC
jgi:hypothetical protein